MSLWQQIAGDITRSTNRDFNPGKPSSMGGGCINQAYKLSDGKRHYFVKINSLQYGDMFAAEAAGLSEMTASHTVRVPAPICTGAAQDQAYIIMEYLDLNGRINPTLLGQQLATMHQCTAPQFGWHRDNTIGSTAQLNQQSDNWVSFWREQRLLPQIALAHKNGYGAAIEPIERLCENFAPLFSDYSPKPSLLHGDLWGGNAAALDDGTPVIFDPALYFGDHEADLAMTYLFGGFNAEFYSAYNDVWPIDPGFKQRKTFYNLYHIINHLNLFGSAYLGQSVSMANQLLSEM